MTLLTLFTIENLHWLSIFIPICWFGRSASSKANLMLACISYCWLSVIAALTSLHSFLFLSFLFLHFYAFSHLHTEINTTSSNANSPFVHNDVIQSQAEERIPSKENTSHLQPSPYFFMCKRMNCSTETLLDRILICMGMFDQRFSTFSETTDQDI